MMKNYIKWLIGKLLVSVAIVWVFGMLALMMKEMFTVAGALEVLPSCAIFACLLFVVISMVEVWDFAKAAKNHEVPISWVIRAKYELGWDEVTCYYSDNFREKFLAEIDDEK